MKQVLRLQLVLAILLLAACTPAPVTPTPIRITPVMPPTLAPTPPGGATPTLIPTLAVTPTPVPVQLDKWQIYTDPDKAFSFRFPPDWGGQTYSQAITRTLTPVAVDFLALHGPGGAAAPEFALLYNWPPLEAVQPVTNTTAWTSVAGLARVFLYPNCNLTMDKPQPVTVGGQQTLGARFVVACDRVYAGYVTGLVHQGVNYGMIVDVPVENWDAWRPTFEALLASFTFGP